MTSHYNYPPSPPTGHLLRVKKKADSRDRLLKLSEKSLIVDHRLSAGYSPELRPRMGLRAKDKCRNSMFVSEQSLPEKFSQALKHLRPGALVHSASSSNAFKLKSKGTVAADDVVYISAPEPRANKHRSPDKRRHHSVYIPSSPSQSDLLVPVRDPTIKDLDQIRNLYKSVPNVSTLEDHDLRLPRRFADDLEISLSCSSSRSPTDSGYRSTPRHITEENPYMLDDDESDIVSHKTTTIVHVNGDSSPEPEIHLRVHGPQQVDLSTSGQGFGVLSDHSDLPVNERDVLLVLQGRRCHSLGALIDISIVPRLVTLLHKELLSLTDHIRRLSMHSPKITTDDVTTATKLSYPVEVFSSCIKSGSQALSIYALSGTGALKRSLQQRAELKFPVGKIYRWMVDMMVNKPMSDTVPVYLAAVLECLLEELVIKLIEDGRTDVMTLNEFDNALEDGDNVASFFHRVDRQYDSKPFSEQSSLEITDSISAIRHKILAATEGSLSSSKSKKRSQISLSRSGLRSLLYFINRPDSREKETTLTDWTRLIFAFAEHRMSAHVDDADVQQAARVLIVHDCPPPSVCFWRHDVSSDCSPQQATTHFAFSLIATGRPENIHHATHFLQDKIHAMNPFGLTALSECVLRGDEETTRLLLSAGCAVNVGVPRSKAENSPYLLTEYTGWSPLTWAIGTQNMICTDVLLNNGAELSNDTMIRESPIQLAVQTGHSTLIDRLLSCSADVTRSSIVYDSTQACFRSHGCPSAIALLAARGNEEMIDTLMDRLGSHDRTSSVDDFLRNERRSTETEKSEFHQLPLQVRLALQEAVYYSVETSRPEIALRIKDKVNGLAWNVYTWTRAVQAAAEMSNDVILQRLLMEFGPKLASELTEENIGYQLSVLFSLVKRECRRENGNPKSAAFAISRMWHYFNQNKSDNSRSRASTRSSHRQLIDASFVNNSHLSDVRFMVRGEPVHGHRIVLFNASDRFRSLLQSPNGIIEIEDISHQQFISMMEFLYTGRVPSIAVCDLFSLASVSNLYSLPSLRTEILQTLADRIDASSIADIYKFAIAHTSSLVDDCERFVLEQFDTVISDSKLRQLIVSPYGDYELCCALCARLASVFEQSRSNKHVVYV